uniref:Uncharacterized protein n=1 Tax=Candidatus Kentrum sp. LFY TaxID=2126342 RepID=A0A450UE90_9GAMM|nr:MAG: hypothetical protein BECKLFY1418B_GA0070995_102139 [Candidatus Kentron sp. LFY]VFJ96809.1 MAG: hypothetical protein BECKLFY1418A_GA0070994_106318 [Candidatus Kentron sp. LFY]
MHRKNISQERGNREEQCLGKQGYRQKRGLKGYVSWLNGDYWSNFSQIGRKKPEPNMLVLRAKIDRGWVLGTRTDSPRALFR